MKLCSQKSVTITPPISCSASKTDRVRKTFRNAKRKIEREKKSLEAILEERVEQLDQQRDTMKGLERKIAYLERENERLKKENNHLNEVIKDQRPLIKTRLPENNRFSDEMRQTVITLQGKGQVPASRCAEVIQIVGENLFGYNFDSKNLPKTRLEN